MKIQFWSIGKPHEKYIKEGVEGFTSRISKYFKVEWMIISPVKNAATMSEVELKRQEAEVVLQKLDDDDFLVLMDERGKNISSEELASLLQQRANESTKRIVFLIGGAFGVDEKLFKRATLPGVYLNWFSLTCW